MEDLNPFPEVIRIFNLESRFTILNNIGKGTYAEVLKAQDNISKDILALKKIKHLQDSEGFPLNTIREVDILQQLFHPNIIVLKQIITCDKENRVYLSFPYYEYDLYGLIYSPLTKTIETVNYVSYIYHAIAAVSICHQNNIIHRDLKPANLFINTKNQLTLGDFGLARRIPLNKPNINLTPHLITLYYRSPEMLLGTIKYGVEVDLWSLGCVIYETLTRKPLFQSVRGNDEFSQLEAIFNLCGFPTTESWPEFFTYQKTSLFLSSRSKTDEISSKERITLEKLLSDTIPPELHLAIDLLLKLLRLNPLERISASEALQHPLFKHYGEKLLPSNLSILDYPELHQTDVHQRNKP